MTEATSTEEETTEEEKPVYGNASVEDLDIPEYTEDQINDFMALYDESISGIKEGQIVNGRVVAITANEVMVDIGFKSEGIVSLREFSDADTIEAGQEVERTTGWERNRWEQLAGVTDLGPDLPAFKPG